MVSRVVQFCFMLIFNNIYHFPLYIFNCHSCHHNSECDIIRHWGIVVCKIHTWNLAETFCHKSGTVHTIPFHLKYPSTPNQSTVIWTVISFHMSPHTHSNIFLNSRRIASLHFSLDIKSGSHQASWKLCGSSGSDIVLVTKAISCNLQMHSFLGLTLVLALFLLQLVHLL